jgi:hypothetical protein
VNGEGPWTFVSRFCESVDTGELDAAVPAFSDGLDQVGLLAQLGLM